MKLIFHKIRYKNFLSSGNVWTEIDLDKAPITLIVGKNGAGKSTVLDALCFCLFKKPFRKVTLGLLVNSVTKKNCVVEVEFSIGVDQYKVVRGLKPNIFEVWKNGTMMNQTAATDDYQSHLEDQVLKVNHKAFCQVVVLGSANYTPFLELSVPDRRKIIENILDLEIFSIMNVITKKRNQDNDKLVQELSATKIGLESQLKYLSQFGDEKRRLHDEQINFKEVRLQGYRDLIKTKKNFLLDGFTKVDVDKAYVTVNLHLKNISACESKMATCQNNIKKFEKEISFYQNNCACDVCKQNIDEEFKTKIIEEKEQYIRENNDVYNELNKTFEEEEKSHQKAYEIYNKIIDTHQSQEKIQFEISTLIKDGKALKAEIDTMNAQVFNDETAAIQEAQQALDKVTKDYDAAMRLKERIAVALKILKDDGAKAKVIKGYTQTINEFINKFLLDMDFMCQFNLDENFNEIIKSRYRDEFVYNSFSEGEKMRIDLAILFTWREIASRRNSINTNIIFFDETLDSSLDADGIDSYANIIKSLTEGQNVFIISHNDKNIDRFETVLEFRKKKGFSTVVK